MPYCSVETGSFNITYVAPTSVPEAAAVPVSVAVDSAVLLPQAHSESTIISASVTLIIFFMFFIFSSSGKNLVIYYRVIRITH